MGATPFDHGPEVDGGRRVDTEHRAERCAGRVGEREVLTAPVDVPLVHAASRPPALRRDGEHPADREVDELVDGLERVYGATRSWQELVGILLCMVFARSAAMAFNRLVDRRIDAKNPRTAARHLPAGTLSVTVVVAFTVFTAAGFLASTLVFYVREPSNPWPLYLAVPVLLFVLGYSLTKRFTSLAHFWLGAALMLAPVAAWIASAVAADAIARIPIATRTDDVRM